MDAAKKGKYKPSGEVVDEWDKFAKGMKEKRQKKAVCTTRKSEKTDVGSNILKCKKLTIQPLESVPSGKAKKYERSGPQEFVDFDETLVSIEHIRDACDKHFAGRIPGQWCTL